MREGVHIPLKQMLSSYGCYSCRYRVRGHCQGTRSGGSEALWVSVAVEATAVWSRLISIREYSYRVTVSTVCVRFVSPEKRKAAVSTQRWTALCALLLLVGMGYKQLSWLDRIAARLPAGTLACECFADRTTHAAPMPPNTKSLAQRSRTVPMPIDLRSHAHSSPCARDSSLLLALTLVTAAICRQVTKVHQG